MTSCDAPATDRRRATLGDREHARGDGGEPVTRRAVEAVGERDEQAVGRHHGRLPHARHAFGEVGDEPVEVAGLGTQRLTHERSSARGRSRQLVVAASGSWERPRCTPCEWRVSSSCTRYGRIGSDSSTGPRRRRARGVTQVAPRDPRRQRQVVDDLVVDRPLRRGVRRRSSCRPSPRPGGGLAGGGVGEVRWSRPVADPFGRGPPHRGTSRRRPARRRSSHGPTAPPAARRPGAR